MAACVPIIQGILSGYPVGGQIKARVSLSFSIPTISFGNFNFTSTYPRYGYWSSNLQTVNLIRGFRGRWVRCCQ